MNEEQNELEIVKVKKIEIPIELMVKVETDDVSESIFEKRTKSDKKTKSCKNEVPIWEKMTLTINEAAAYSNIGGNRLRELAYAKNCSFVLYVGTKVLIKRIKFEEYINNKVTV